MTSQSDYRVRAVHCDHMADEETIYQALARATDPLDRAWAKLKAAKRIGIKFNQEWPVETLLVHKGQFQELVAEKVARAVLRLLRERTTGELICSSISVFRRNRTHEPDETNHLGPLLREFGVRFVEGDLPPHTIVQVPEGGRMFRQYILPTESVDVDAFISVAKMKNHAFMGVTACLKNLFGLMPETPYGRARQYWHHLVRMPYMLADLGRVYHPALNIVDGLVCQAEREWGGKPRIGNCMVAGDHVIATDACTAYLMGHDPTTDWPNEPFLRDRNSLLAAAEGGFGTVNLSEIDFQSEVTSPVAEFFTERVDPSETTTSWRRTTCEQALYYRDHREQFAQYAGEYILLYKNRVIWHNKDSNFHGSRRDLAAEDPNSAIYMKYVDPTEAEGEHFEIYEQTLAQMDAMGM